MKNTFGLLFSIIIGGFIFFSVSAFGYQADIDTTFSIGTGFNNTAEAITIQPDGKMVVGGSFLNYGGSAINRIIRLNADGSRDAGFSIGSAFDSNVYTLAMQNDGKIVVGGNFFTYNGTYGNANRITRLNSNGTRDTSFNIGGGFNMAVYALAVQPDGKILAGGTFQTYQSIAANYIIRLNADGSRDTGFNMGNGFNNMVRSIVLQPDNKILIGGYFDTYNGSVSNRIIRLNADGTRDTSFNVGSGFDNNVRSIVLQPDGKILAGGDFISYSGTSANRIIRLNTDGSRDTGFNIGAGFDGIVMKVGIQSDNKVLVEGMFTNYKGTSANRIIRLNTDGSIDTGFNMGSGFNNTVRSLAIQPDGEIVIVGSFINYQGISTNRIVRLKGNSPIPVPVAPSQQDIEQAFTYRGYIIDNGVFSGSTRFSLKQTSGFIPRDITINNQNNKLFLPANIQFKKTNNTDYTGSLTPPTPYTISDINGNSVINAINVGNPNESLNISGGLATLSILASGQSIGNPVKIFSSQDGINWTDEGNATITQVDGQPYAVFTTNHFTYFAIAGSTGSFVINNDDATTTSQTVNLTISAPTAQYMRFSNTSGSNRSSWEAYNTTKSRTLSNDAGTKTVYAEFDTDGNTSTVEASSSDSIEYVVSLLPNQGNLSLEISTGVSECIYGTSLNLGEQSAKIDTAYSFTGDFTGGNWMCTDYKASNGTRSFTIQTSDLDNGKGNSINSGLVELNHSTGTISGDPKCKVGIATGNNWSLINTPYTIMERSSGGEQVCKVTIPRVSMRIGVPANQAPGNYSGTLTLTIQGL